MAFLRGAVLTILTLATCFAGPVVFTPGALYAPITQPMTVHVIWYGTTTWTSTIPLAATVVPQLIQDSSYLVNESILRSYLVESTPNQFIRGQFVLGTQAHVPLNAAYGTTTIDSTGMQTLITASIGAADVPAPVLINGLTSTLYLIMLQPGTRSIANECGAHVERVYNGTIAYGWAYVQDVTQASCQQTPNAVTGSIYTDKEVDIIWHEMSEAAAVGWADSNGAEIADLCQFQYGATNTAPNGWLYNNFINGHYYLLQSLWYQYPQSSNVGACVLQISSPTFFTIG